MISFADMPVPSRSASMPVASEKKMGMSGKTVARFGEIAENLTERTARYLRLIHPIKTAECVSADTGVSANTVSKWLAGVAYPNGRATMALIDAYGLEFLASVLPSSPQWLDRTLRAEHQARLEAEHERIGLELEALRR